MNRPGAFRTIIIAITLAIISPWLAIVVLGASMMHLHGLHILP